VGLVRTPACTRFSASIRRPYLAAPLLPRLCGAVLRNRIGLAVRGRRVRKRIAPRRRRLWLVTPFNAADFVRALCRQCQLALAAAPQFLEHADEAASVWCAHLQ
jgi:hypothetical protein